MIFLLKTFGEFLLVTLFGFDQASKTLVNPT